MKQKLLLKSLLLLFALIAGINSAWADTATITFSSQTSGTSDSSTAYTTSNFVSSGIASSSSAFGTITCSATDKCYSGKTGYGLKAGGSSNAGSFTLAFSTPLTNVTKITLNRASYSDSKTANITVKNGTTTLANAVSTPSSSAAFADMDITNLSINSLAGLTVETSKYCYIKSITITYTPSATPTCSTPTITPASGAVVSGTEVTLSTTTEGASIFYTMGENPADPTASSTLYNPNSKPTITAATTIKAIAVKEGSNNSTVASATYTILPKKTISEARAQASGTVYTQGIVTYLSGKTAYIQDNTAAIAVYNSAANLEVAVGDEITVVGTRGEYNGLQQIQTPTINILSNNNPVTPIVKTIAEINTDNSGSKALQCMLVKIEDATVTAKSGSTTTNATIKQSENTIEVRNIAQAVEYAVHDKLTLQGHVGIYNNIAQIINPSNVVVTQNQDPAINAANVSIEFDATSGEIDYTIDNPTEATLTAAKTTGDWISNVQVDAVNSKVTFTVTTNDGAERTGTITLSYTGAEDKVVTVTQKKCGIANLPFAWAGGTSADLTALLGVTANGLGDDYNANNHSPYLVKFDGTGDYIQMRTNARPGRVIVAVKKIGGAGVSTITFQGSSDGSEFHDVEAFSINGAQNAIVTLKTTKAFATNDKYVRIKFTQVSNGNVGVGPISIAEYTDVSKQINSTYSTLTSEYALDFTNSYGMTAYIVKDNDASDGYVTLTQVNKVPANTGLILKVNSTGYPYSIPVLTGAADDVSGNLMTGSAFTTTAVAANGGYILKNGAFHPANAGNLPAGKAYLNLAVPSNNASPLILDFGDGTTNITTTNFTNGTNNRGEVYNLAGQRVAQPTKGLYIVNGKKFVVK